MILGLLNRFADAHLRRRQTVLTATIKRLAVNNRSLRTVNTALSAQVLAKEHGQRTLQRLLELEKERSTERLARADELEAKLRSAEERLAECEECL